MPMPTATKKYCSCQFWFWEKRYQSMFQPVRAFFQSEPLKNTFLECLHTIYVEGTHTKTLNFESGPASDNNLESGKVTRGHRNLRSWWKKVSRNVIKLALQLFHLCKHKSISKISKNDKEHEKKIQWPPKLAYYRFYKNSPWARIPCYSSPSDTGEDETNVSLLRQQLIQLSLCDPCCLSMVL